MHQHDPISVQELGAIAATVPISCTFGLVQQSSYLSRQALCWVLPTAALIRSSRAEKPFLKGPPFSGRWTAPSVPITEQPFPTPYCQPAVFFIRLPWKIQPRPQSASAPPCFSYRLHPLPLLPEVCLKSIFQPAAQRLTPQRGLFQLTVSLR